ncbi:MAG: aminoglycoside phosphotransferase (APT) family kinase protein [Saprospiraceae bacterium]|jgi:aminoglycoside phosphotransferase (APT) family kinase protein
MIKSVRKGEELNENNLIKFLYENKLIDGNKAELTVSQFSNGYSNLTYLIESNDKSYVLRMPPIGATKRGHDMSREYKVLSQLSKGFSKMPKAYAYSKDENILGRAFYIMEKIEGEIITYKRAKELDISANDFAKISNSWLDTFVELHSTDYKACGLENLGKPNGYVERQVTNWGKQYLKAQTQEVPEAIKVMEWMESNQPKNYDHCLIHNDFKYDNVVFTDTSWNSINAVLDWEMCTLGDPLMDLGTSIAYWSMPSDPPPLIEGLPSPTMLPGNPSRTEIAELYAQRSGREIDNLVFYYAYGLFKIAVIVQQIYYRYEKGLTTNEKFKHLDKSSQFLCMMAWQSIQKNRIENLF